MGHYLSTEQLLKDAQDPRLNKQPVWVQELVYELATRLKRSDLALEGARSKAAAELDAVRQQLASGPADSDTYVEMPKSIMSDETREITRRPVGKGVTVEFRRPGETEGEGFEVRLNPDGRLRVDCMSLMAVCPSYNGGFEVMEVGS